MERGRVGGGSETKEPDYGARSWSYSGSKLGKFASVFDYKLRHRGSLGPRTKTKHCIRDH